MKQLRLGGYLYVLSDKTGKTLHRTVDGMSRDDAQQPRIR